MTLSVNVLQLTRAQAAAKRACDVLISGLGLLALLPLFAVVAAAIKLTSPGPSGVPPGAVGLRGRPFTLLKFRTMVVGADRMLDTLRERTRPTGRCSSSARTRGSPGSGRPAPLLDRRAAPALERPQGRDEPGRAAAAAGRRGRPVRGLAARPARGPARHHRPGQVGAASCPSRTTSGSTCSTSRTGRSPTTCSSCPRRSRSWSRPGARRPAAYARSSSAPPAAT